MISQVKRYFKNDGKYYSDRRASGEEWPTLPAMYKEFQASIIDLNNKLRDLNHKLDQYNGLQEKLQNHSQRLTNIESCQVERRAVRGYKEELFVFFGKLVGMLVGLGALATSIIAIYQRIMGG